MARRTTLLWLLALAAACGGASQRAGSTSPPAPRSIAFELGDAERKKLSPQFEQRWRGGEFHADEYTPVIVQGITNIGEAEVATLGALGGKHAWPVTTRPGNDGDLVAQATDAPTDWFVVHVTGDKLAKLVALPWVTRLEIAGGYPAGPRLPKEIEQRIGARLSFTLAVLGRERPYQVTCVGEARGCLTDRHRSELAAQGASNVWIGHPAPDCAYTIFSLDVRLDMVTGLASLPWIVRIDESQQGSPDDGGAHD